jgi:hypothetical protein
MRHILNYILFILEKGNGYFFLTLFNFVTSGFRRDANQNCTLLGYNAASSGNPLLTFRDNVSVAFSRAKNSKKGITRRCIIPQRSAVLISIAV